MTSKTKSKEQLMQFICRNPQVGTAAVLLLMLLFFTLLSPINKAGTNVFLSWQNLATILEMSAAFSIGAFAMTMVLLSGGIDLSCGATIGLGGMVAAKLCTYMGFNVAFAAILALLVGVIVGLINAFLIVEVKVPPFLATIGTAGAVQGIAYMISNGRQIYLSDPMLLNVFGFGRFLGIPVLAWWTAVFLIITYVIIWRTKFGRRLQAVGGNEVAAVNSGVNIRMVKYPVYAFMGLVSVFVSLTLAARLEVAIPQQGTDYALKFIVASVLGGTTFSGGGGNVFAVLLGSLVLAVFSNGLNLLGTHYYLKMILEGIIVILAIVGSVVLERRRER